MGMNIATQRRIAGLTLGLMMSVGLAACGGDAAPVVPTAVPTAIAVATDIAKPAAPTATTAPVAPTDTVAMVAPTATTLVAAPTATTAMAAATDTALPAAPTATTAAAGNGGGGGGIATGNAGLLQQATAGMRDLKSYRMEITSEVGAQKSQISADVDVANKGLKMTSVAAGYSTVIIVIGDKSWLSADGGKAYTASPGGAAMAASMDGFINMWKATGTSATVTTDAGIKEGSPATEQIDGTDTKHLVVDNSAMGGATAGSAEMWISTGAKPTIRQMKSTVTTSGQTAKSTIKWSKLDEDLGIKDPTK